MFKRETIFFLFCCSFFMTVMVAQQIKTVCYGATKTYFVDLDDGPNGTIGSSYEWTVLESNDAIITGNGTNSISINWANTLVGNYTIQVVETNESCMSSTSILPIRIKSNPVITAQGATVCSGFSGLISTNTTSVIPLQYSWTYPTDAVNPGNVNSFEANVSGDYVVTVRDNHGCVSDPATATLVVNSLPSATIIPEGPTQFCEGGSVILSAPAGLSGYTWSKDGIEINENGLTDRLLTVFSSGSYAVTTIDNKGCINSTETPILVNVNSLPIIDITSSGPIEFCDGDSVTLTASATGSELVYQWLNKGVEITGQVEPNFKVFTESDYSVKVVDNNTCESTSGIVDVTVRSNPDSTITHSTPATFCAGDKVVLSVPMVSGYSYQWSDSLGNILAATNATYLANESSDYSVKIIDTNYSTFCTSLATTPVKVVKKVLPVVSAIQEN